MSGAPSAIPAPLLERLDQAIDRLGPLPVVDRTLLRVRELADDPDSSTPELVAALEADANLTANLLRYANSAYAARPLRANSVHQAVTLVGRRAIGTIALEAAVCSYFEKAPGVGGVARGQLHMHAAQVGALSAELARRSQCDPVEGHLAGLLHDLGKLVLPELYGAAAADRVGQSAVAGPARVEAERQAFGLDHAFAGARFAQLAELSDGIVAGIGMHHGGDVHEPAAACVQAANATVALLGGQPYDAELLEAALRFLELDESALEDAVATALPSLGGCAALASRTAAKEMDELEREARTDDLTGLLNRRYWSSTAREHLAGSDAAVLIVDVDHFKSVNDIHGHHVGDFVLVEIAGILAARGVAGRLGGDEFAVLVTPAEAGPHAAESIVADVARHFAEGTVDVGVSVGVALTDAPHTDLSETMHAADDALYEAKRAGRSQFCLAG